MEINITFFIETIMFFLLFLFLSRILFIPLDNLFSVRERKILDEQLKTAKINEEINKQKIYIDEQISLKTQETKELYKKFQNVHIANHKNEITLFKSAVQRKYLKILLKLEDETSIIRKKLNKNKHTLAMTIYCKLYKN